MNEQAQIFIGGEWYEVGGLRRTDRITTEHYLSDGFTPTARLVSEGFGCDSGSYRHPLTKIPEPIAHKLGKQVLEAAGEYARRAIAYRTTPTGQKEAVVYSDGSYCSAHEGCNRIYHIILSPPEQPKKTDREMLDEVLKLGLCVSAGL